LKPDPDPDLDETMKRKLHEKQTMMSACDCFNAVLRGKETVKPWVARAAAIFVGAAAAMTLDVNAAPMPKVGVTLAFRGGYGSAQYVSNASFKGRPVVEDFAKQGLDLCYYAGWRGAKTPLASLKQFNAVWLVIDHEDQCPYPAEETIAALKEYVSAGGGLVVTHSGGRYSEAPVDAYWTKVYAAFGLDLLHEEIVDDATSARVDRHFDLFRVEDFADHPIAEGIPGLWLPIRRSMGSWGVTAFRTSPEWQWIARTSPTARSVPKGKIDNRPKWDQPGTFAKGPIPVVAARAFGKGRVVFIAIHKDNVGWAYNIDRWPNWVERSVFNDKRSDALGLLENACAWTAEPSLTDASFTADYKPVEPDYPPYTRHDVGRHENEKPVWKARPVADRKPGVVGLIGLHSSYSDGASTVAEYVAEAKRLGLSFLVFTDPIARLTEDTLGKLRADCAANSSEEFYCCPGVEFREPSGYEWMLFSDKVSWPQESVHRDGRDYVVFDGKNMLQPGNYRGQNLYRGCLLNLGEIPGKGSEYGSLHWMNEVVAVGYGMDADGSRVLYNNAPAYRELPRYLLRCATVSYTRVKRAADLARAKDTSVTCAESLAGVRKMANAQGHGANRAAVAAHVWAAYGTDAEIRDFTHDRILGTDTLRFTVRAVSPTGLKALTVHDATLRVLARFDAKGAKAFEKTFTVTSDRQMYPQLVVEDVKGGKAVSTMREVNYPHAGLHRCGDNFNLLSYNPHVVMHPNWDTQLCPPYKFILMERKHFQISEATFWEAFERAPSREPSVRIQPQWNTLRLENVPFPSEQKHLMASSRTEYTLVAPNVVAIFDQTQGERLVEPTRSDTHGTFSNCPLAIQVGENEWWRHRYRVYQFTDRMDAWWMAVYHQVSPDYRGGYTVVEGALKFLRDATITEPLTLVRLRTHNPKGTVEVFRRNVENFGPGSYHASCGSPAAWHAFFGLKDSVPLVFRESKLPDGVETRVMLTESGRRVKAGEQIRYRFALGSFCEKPHGGMYCDWFASMLDGSGFNHEAVVGRVTDVNGMVEVAAEGNVAKVTFGPTWFIQDYPVRISGLVDNGTAYVMDGAGRLVRPLAFENGRAYAEIPLEKRQTWTFLNLFVADDPALRLSYVPAMPGHEKPTLQILNPTDRDISTRVTDVRTRKTFTVSVPASGCADDVFGAQ